MENETGIINKEVVDVRKATDRQLKAFYSWKIRLYRRSIHDMVLKEVESLKNMSVTEASEVIRQLIHESTAPYAQNSGR